MAKHIVSNVKTGRREVVEGPDIEREPVLEDLEATVEALVPEPVLQRLEALEKKVNDLEARDDS